MKQISSDHVGSEVAAVRRQIDLQEEAAARALSNGAITAPHETISHTTHRDLARQVGHDQAMQVIIEQYGWTPEEIAAGAAPNTRAIARIKTEIEGVCRELKTLKHQPDEPRCHQLYHQFGELMTALDDHMEPAQSIEVAATIYNRVFW